MAIDFNFWIAILVFICLTALLYSSERKKLRGHGLMVEEREKALGIVMGCFILLSLTLSYGLSLCAGNLANQSFWLFLFNPCLQLLSLWIASIICSKIFNISLWTMSKRVYKSYSIAFFLDLVVLFVCFSGVSWIVQPSLITLLIFVIVAQLLTIRSSDQSIGPEGFYSKFKFEILAVIFSVSMSFMGEWVNQTVRWICLGLSLVPVLSYLTREESKKKKEAGKPAVLFDLDGTLVDTQPLIFETFKQVFQELKPGYTLKKKELQSFFGPTLEETFKRYFTADQIPAVIERYQQINLSLHDDMIKEISGAKELLEALKEAGYKVGIVSNKRRKVVDRGLEKMGLMPYVEVVFGKDDLKHPKPSGDGLLQAADALHASRDHLIYVGDNTTDILAAHDAGAKAIGFSIDSFQKKAIEKSGSDYSVDSLLEILDVLKEEQVWNDKSILQS